MKIAVLLLFLGHWALSDELKLQLSESEEKRLISINRATGVAESFAKFLNLFHVNTQLTYDTAGKVLSCTGEKEDLKITEYLFISHFKDSPELTLKFIYFEGSPKERRIKHRFEKKLTTNSSNIFQYSNRLVDGKVKDINGFTFDLVPGYDPHQNTIKFFIKLSYKNEEKVIGDKGAQVLDLYTTIRMEYDKETVLKVTDKNDPGWKENSYLSFTLSSKNKSTYFENYLPVSLEVKEGYSLRHAYLSKGLFSLLEKDPVEYLKSLGVAFPSGSNAVLNKERKLLFILNTQPNLDLFDAISTPTSSAFNDNIEWDVSIYESNLIIKDPDKLEGHTLQKVTSFGCICSQNNTFTFSKRFNGNYESVVYMDALMPESGDRFNYNVILKKEGPKLKAQNYKFKAFFGKNKKYRVPLDNYHFMEISVEK